MGPALWLALKIFFFILIGAFILGIILALTEEIDEKVKNKINIGLGDLLVTIFGFALFLFGIVNGFLWLIDSPDFFMHPIAFIFAILVGGYPLYKTYLLLKDK